MNFTIVLAPELFEQARAAALQQKVGVGTIMRLALDDLHVTVTSVLLRPQRADLVARGCAALRSDGVRVGLTLPEADAKRLLIYATSRRQTVSAAVGHALTHLLQAGGGVSEE